MTTPTRLSVSNVALPNAADSGNVNITIPSGANACRIGGTYYVSDSSVITSITGSVFAATTNGALRVNNPSSGAYMGTYSALFKVTGTGAQTVRVQKTGAYSEGPTCQIIWYTVDDADNFVPTGGHVVVQQTASPQALAATVNSNTGDLVDGFFGTDGSSADPTAPTGTTLQGSMQTTQFDKQIAFSVNSPGASTTTVTAGSRDFPTLSLASLRGSSGPTPTNYTLTCDVGAYSLTGIAALLRRGYSLVASVGSYSLAGQDAALRRGYSLAADVGTYALTGQDAALRRGYSLVCDVGSYSLTGHDATLTYSAGGTAYTLTCDVGSYALTGYDATLTYTPGAANYSLACDTGSYVLAGQNAVTSLGRRMVADVGAYSLTGVAATLSVGRRLVCDTGSYSLTGYDATLTAVISGPIAYSLPCETGVYVLTGGNADLTFVEVDDIVLLGGGPGGPKKKKKRVIRTELDKDSYLYRLLSPEVREQVTPEVAEVIEAKAVEVVEQKAKPSPKAVRNAFADEGIAYRQAYKEIYLELIGEIRKAQADEEEEEEAIAMALIL